MMSSAGGATATTLAAIKNNRGDYSKSKTSIKDIYFDFKYCIITSVQERLSLKRNA